MQLRPEQLQARLAKGLAPLYLISGDEPLLAQECADAVRRAAREQGYQERECLTVEPGFDWGRLHQARDSLSLFASRRLLELRLGTHKPGDAGARALIAYAERPAEETVLLITCGKLDAATLKSRWCAALDAAGVVVQVWPVGVEQLPGWLGERLRRAGFQPSAEALAWLAERVEGNLLAAAQEVEKLRLLFGGGPLDLQRLRAVVADSARYSIYDLADAAVEGCPARVVRILDGLRQEGEEPVLILWALHRELRQLVALLQELQQGVALEVALQRHKVWEKRKPLYKRALRRLTLAQGRRLLALVAQADAVIKGIERDDAWDALLRLGLGLAGQEPL
ncbi:MAG TPA: DNA polymerase III subunit delta [Candidatus Competibacteraceae bacterium]|nr:DNA polymerase III subunit delta [Candidatus Competibacteraceae bacterium]